jgi:hypothetical protein
MFELCHIFKKSVYCLYAMILPCILVVREQNIQSVFTSRSTSIPPLPKCLCPYLQYLCYLKVDSHNQHRPEIYVSHSVSVPPHFPVPY